MKRRWELLFVLAWTGACGKSHVDSEQATSKAEPARGVDAGSGAAAAPSASATGESLGPAAASWKGSYKSAASGLYIPPDWKGVHYVLKDTSDGIGEGQVALLVDAASGRVRGTLEGPLGPATIDGIASDGKVFATIRRTDPADRGFTGTLVATLANDRGEGTMNVSQAEVNAIRAATFALSRDGAAR